jgi:hypothetical protein
MSYEELASRYMSAPEALRTCPLIESEAVAETVGTARW